MSTPTGKRLHLGCGRNAVDGWVNVDGSWSAILAKVPVVWRALHKIGLLSATQPEVWPRKIRLHNVRRRLPFGPGGFTAVYASHLLEHLYLDEAKTLLRDCHRVLMPGGVIRLVVPDLKTLVMEYLAAIDHGDRLESGPFESPADRLNVRLRFRESSRPQGHILQRLYTAMTDFHSHKWMYDSLSLIRHLQEAGFVDVVEMAFGTSRIEGVGDIELPERVLNGEGVCVEGIKPYSRVVD
jgi:predicted SAM-dependent methyltransferase